MERAGDGFMIAFPTAIGAVEDAISLQRALEREAELAGSGVRIRIGIDTGEVITEEHGYFGRTVFAAARISELAGPGQILVSEATMLLAGPDRFELTDQGEHELRGLALANRLFEAAWQGA